jgi:hypothetical protein
MTYCALRAGRAVAQGDAYYDAELWSDDDAVAAVSLRHLARSSEHQERRLRPGTRP